MVTNADDQFSQIENVARILAERLASPEGQRSLTEAKAATLARTRERQEASRVDPKLLQKIVTL